ncbi:MAG: M24 family metallopeptidase, partial [Bauldia sp.]
MVNYVEASLAPLKNDGQIKLHGATGFAGMRRAGRLVAECLDALEDIIAPGLPTEEVDRFVHSFALAHDALPATLGYKGYMKSTCVSINHVVCHGIPSQKPLRDGDIANVDVT